MSKKKQNFTSNVHVLITEEQKKYIDFNLNQFGIGKFFRACITTLMENESFRDEVFKTITSEEKENSVQAAIARKEQYEIDQSIKEKNNLIRANKRMVLEMAKKNNWSIDEIPDWVINFAVGACKISTQMFMNVLRNKTE
jgi:mannitol-1-phosphate/altronate dehydrogenase